MKKIEIITLRKVNIKNFAKERNILLKKAKSDWVFFLDSDEKMTAALKKEIQNAIKSKKFNGYDIKRINYFMGEYAGTDKIVRLGRKGSGTWHRAVHEVWEMRGEVGELKNHIIHDTGSMEKMVNKINFYSTLHARENLKEGKKATFLKIIFYPLFKFFESFFSGRGVIMSMLQSFHSFLSWSKQWELQKN